MVQARKVKGWKLVKNRDGLVPLGVRRLLCDVSAAGFNG
jgi:hypothetical protein